MVRLRESEFGAAAANNKFHRFFSDFLAKFLWLNVYSSDSFYNGIYEYSE